MTFKIPVAVYPATLAALSGTGLGTQLSLSQQAQDVTQQVADVSSRVASDEAAITQLRALLAHAGSVGELLSVQDQINSEEVRPGVDARAAERAQPRDLLRDGDAHPRRAEGRRQGAAKPSRRRPGYRAGCPGGWHAFRLTLSWLLTVIGAVAPFAAVVAVIGGLGWWARRRVTAAAGGPTPGHRRGRRRGLRPPGSGTVGYGATVPEPWCLWPGRSGLSGRYASEATSSATGLRRPV